eukprot:1250573-Rhodomonas_salina.4
MTASREREEGRREEKRSEAGRELTLIPLWMMAVGWETVMEDRRNRQMGRLKSYTWRLKRRETMTILLVQCILRTYKL